MKPMPCSSGEEDEEKACLEEKGERSINYDWIKELLGMSDEEPDQDVVVREVNKPELKSKSSILTPAVKDDDEDDCVVLDGDPDNVVTTVEEGTTGSDELFVVGEKGQIACRDYAHPRHLCVNFPFSSTPHERHCDQCHCYVCDSLAPCLKWGIGLSSTDHCHATDKSEMWKILRKNLKLGKTVSLPAPTNYGTLHDFGNPLHNHFLPHDIMQLSPNSMLLNQTSRSSATHTCSPVNLIHQDQASQPIMTRTSSLLNYGLQNQVCRSNTVPVCSRASNFMIRHGANHGRYQESGYTLVRNRHRSHSAPRQLLSVRNHAIQRVQGRGASSLGPHFLYSHMMSKGVGNVGVGSTQTMNHSTHGASGFSNHVNPAQQYDRYNAAKGFSNNGTCYEQNDVWFPKNLLYPLPSSETTSLSSFSKYTTASEAQAYYQSNDSQNLYGSCVQGNDAPSSYVARLNGSQHLNEHQIGSQNENAGGTTGQDSSCQQKPHDESQSESARKVDFSTFDSSWVENTGQGTSYLQSSESKNTPPSVMEAGTQLTGSTNLGSVDDIKNWLFDEEDFVSVGVDGVFSTELNIPSPDLSSIDTGMF